MIYIDFETRSEVDIKKSGAWVYSLHPSTEILCMAVKVGDRPVNLLLPNDLDISLKPKKYGDVLEPEILTGRINHNRAFAMHLAADINYGELVEAHNAFFEKAIWHNIMVKRYGWPEIKPEQWRCSASVAAYHALPRSLGGAGKILGLSTIKDDEGKRVMLQLSKPKPRVGGFFEQQEYPEKFQTLYDYCKSDVEAEYAIANKLGQLPERELKIWQLDQKINQRGVHIDIEAVDKSIVILQQYSDKLITELEILTEGKITSAGQRDKIIEWCKGRGEELPGLTKADVEEALPKTKDAKVKRVLEIRQALSKTSTAKYEAMKNSTAKDGRIRDVLMYHGASTGRWSGKLVQFQNLPRGTIKDMDTAIKLIKCGNLNTIELMTGDVMGFMSSAIRGMVCAPEGKKLLVADFAAIEARVLGWLAEDHNLLNKFRNGDCVYCDAASEVYGFPIIKGEHNYERQVGKTLILAFGYQGGISAMQTMAATYNVNLKDVYDSLQNSFRSYELLKAKERYKEYVKKKAEDKDVLNESEGLVADILKQRWRLHNKKILNYWEFQESSAIKAVNNPGVVKEAGKVSWVFKKDFLKCKLPSGRELHYFKPIIRNSKTPWGSITSKLTYLSEDKGKAFRNGTYGGKLVENITQAVARDLMADAMLRIENEGFKIVLSVHDELIAEIPQQTALQNPLERFCNLMAATPDWAKDCPVEAEGWEGINYKK